MKLLTELPLLEAILWEFAWGEVAWRPTLLRPPKRIENGALVLPVERAGLGARLNDADGA